jgi:hypothetical protein
MNELMEDLDGPARKPAARVQGHSNHPGNGGAVCGEKLGNEGRCDRSRKDVANLQLEYAQFVPLLRVPSGNRLLWICRLPRGYPPLKISISSEVEPDPHRSVQADLHRLLRQSTKD